VRICAVVPAAGRGSRLGIALPKILAPLGGDETIWTVMRRKLLRVADHVNLVVSPEGEALMRLRAGADIERGLVSLSVQPEPIGMGDAIFRGHSIWSRAPIVLVVWGDQIFVSRETLAAACALHGNAARTIALPLASIAEPYVEYVFGDNDRLLAVRQSREGDRCAPGGLGDVGAFVLSTEGLLPEWNSYLAGARAGAVTGEANFLPFLPYLSGRGWSVKRTLVRDAREARGINTPEDLAFFRSLGPIE
jgi:bifunctional N-acetylglucosamine-1-phosphate-uridyltransferase/glucosamine-1-phosphate-acetyltransferase GlmU-like protein